MSYVNKLGRIHEQRLERWVGAGRIAHLQACMRGDGHRWYGRPICLRDVPGSVWITSAGDFVGSMPSGLGYFMSALDAVKDYWDRLGHVQHGYANAGFASISHALSQASSGFSTRRNINKIGPTGVVGVTSTLWRIGPQPAAGAVGGAAPAGTAQVDSDTGGCLFTNPATGSNYLVGADFSTSVINNSLLMYDRLFSVGKTMASTGTEAVSGVPTRYQSVTATDPNYVGDNFGFIEVGGTQLAATAHNWTVCTYTDQGGTGSTLPSVVGNSAGIVDRLDQPVQQWFLPLASGDVGIGSWTQMQCDASVATGVISFCIGHPLGFMAFPLINSFFPFDWLTNRDQAPQIFNDACIAFLEPLKPATTATTYTGRFQMTSV